MRGLQTVCRDQGHPPIANRAVCPTKAATRTFDLSIHPACAAIASSIVVSAVPGAGTDVSNGGGEVAESNAEPTSLRRIMVIKPSPSGSPGSNTSPTRGALITRSSMRDQTNVFTVGEPRTTTTLPLRSSWRTARAGHAPRRREVSRFESEFCRGVIVVDVRHRTFQPITCRLR